MWFKESNMYFCKVEIFAYGEINERSFSIPHPWSVGFVVPAKPVRHPECVIPRPSCTTVGWWGLWYVSWSITLVTISTVPVSKGTAGLFSQLDRSLCLRLSRKCKSFSCWWAASYCSNLVVRACIRLSIGSSDTISLTTTDNFNRASMVSDVTWGDEL